MILGVVLAGGQSNRFGSDKALAEIGGHTLLARAVDALSGLADHVIIAGRDHGPAPCIPDWPRAGMGPLAGLAAGLHHAVDEGYETVLTCSVDCIALPGDLLDALSPAPAYLASQPVIGHWLASSVTTAEEILHSEGRHSMLAFAEVVKARAVKPASALANINTPADLEQWSKTHGL